MSKSKRRGKKPPALDTFKGSRDYLRDLLKLVATLNKLTLQIVLKELDSLGEVRASAPENKLDKVDAAKPKLTAKQKKLLKAIARAEARFNRVAESDAVKSTIKKNAGRTDAANRQQVFKQAKAVLGVTRLENPNTIKERAAFVRTNVDLIKTIGPKHFERIRKIVDDGFANGMSSRVLKNAIQEVGGVSERRAALIARDQIGSLNANLTKARHTANGFDSFVWTTVGDERVRDEHDALNGQEFPYDTGAPGEGFPGDPIACRCFAVPVFKSSKK